MSELEKQRKKEKLTKIEEEIEPLVKNEISWAKAYKLLKEVEENLLYEYEYPSYTSWLKSFSERYNITLSLLWRQKKAGKFYDSFYDYYKQLSIPVTPIERVEIGTDSLTMIEKITGANMREAKVLIDRANAGTVSRTELKTLWELEKQERERNGMSAIRQNAYDAKKFEEYSYDTFGQSFPSYTDIGSILCNPIWLFYRKDAGKKYRLFTQFSKLDEYKNSYIVAEDYNKIKEKEYEFYLHMFYMRLQIKELMGEPVFSGYSEYADFYWLIVPYELLSQGREYIKNFPDIGLVLYNEDSNSLMIQKSAVLDRENGKNRGHTIELIAHTLL